MKKPNNLNQLLSVLLASLIIVLLAVGWKYWSNNVVEGFESKNELTIVTGYFKINRSRSIDYKQGRKEMSDNSDGVYKEWMKGLLSYNGPMIIYCDPDSYDYINNLRKNNKKTIIRKIKIEELYAYKYFKNNINNTKNYTTMVWKEHNNPNINKQLFTVWNSKIDLLKKSVDSNPFNTKYFSWYDIGYLREPKKLDPNWPNKNKLKILDDKILFLGVYGETCKNDLTTGGYIGCNVNNINKLHQLFYNELDKKYKNGEFKGNEGNDQNLMHKIKCENLDFINNIKGEDDKDFYPNVEGKWFYMIPYFN